MSALHSLSRCIRTDLDCSDACATTAAVLTRRTQGDLGAVRASVEACLVACAVCADADANVVCQREGTTGLP